MTKAITKAKDTAVKTTANVLSAPKRIYHDRKSRLADSDYKILRAARDSKDRPSFHGDGRPTEALKIRAMADDVRMRRDQGPISERYK